MRSEATPWDDGAYRLLVGGVTRAHVVVSKGPKMVSLGELIKERVTCGRHKSIHRRDNHSAHRRSHENISRDR